MIGTSSWVGSDILQVRGDVRCHQVMSLQEIRSRLPRVMSTAVVLGLVLSEELWQIFSEARAIGQLTYNTMSSCDFQKRRAH